MNVQPINSVAVSNSWGLEIPSKDIFGEGFISPLDSKVVEVVECIILSLFEQEVEGEYESEEEDPYYKEKAEDADPDAFALLKNKVFSTVDSGIHSNKPKDEEAQDEIKEILCADPDTVSIPKEIYSVSEGQYDLQHNYPRIHELLLDQDKFEDILILLHMATEEERDRMEAVLFRFAVTFDEKVAIFAVYEEEVSLIQKRLKKSIRKVKSRDKKRSIILGLKPEKSASPFLEGFFQKN